MLEKPARLADVAKAAGVSQGTASNVFSRPDVVRAEVRERVLAAAAAIGYTGPDPKGRLLRAGKVNAIGVVTGEPLDYFFEDPYARTFLAHLARACDGYGAGLSLVSARNVDGPAWNIQSALVDGFIILCLDNPNQLVALTQVRQLPYVAITDSLADVTVPAIGIDNYTAALAAGRHIIELGHRRLAVLALPMMGKFVGHLHERGLRRVTYADARDRIRGYRDAAAEVGIAPEAVPVFQTMMDAPSVATCLETLFSQPEPPTALLAQSDSIALLAMAWLKARGLSVPGDVSVIGFDGATEAEVSNPPLTTMVQPYEQMTRLAAQALLAPASGAPLKALLPAQLVVRASTAAPKR